MKNLLLSLCFLLFVSFGASAVEWSHLDSAYFGIYKNMADSKKANLYFENTLIEYLKEGRDIDFANMSGLKFFANADSSICMANWSFPNSSGTSSYSAILWIRSKNDGNVEIHKLLDYSTFNPFPETSVLGKEHWWGAYYYDKIEKNINGETVWFLLGLNFAQKYYTQSVIEVLRFLPSGEIEFGGNYFKNNNYNRSAGFLDTKNKSGETLQRLVFRYNSRTDFILRYDFQAYAKKKKMEKDSLIIFDRLMYGENGLANKYSQITAVGGVYDGLVFKNGVWSFVCDVEARNPNPEKGPKRHYDKPALYRRQ